MSKPAALGAHSVIRRGETAAGIVAAELYEVGTGSDSIAVTESNSGSRLAAKGEAVPSLGYDLHDPNFPFGRAAVVSVPEMCDGVTVGSTEMVLPAVVAPVIDKLVSALADRDRRIEALEQCLDNQQATLGDAPAVTVNGLPISAPALPLPRTPLPKEMSGRLKAAMRRVRYGKDVAAVLTALEEERWQLRASPHQHHRAVLAGLDLILNDVSAIIARSRTLISKKISKDSFSCYEILLFIIYSVATERLKSGYYRGSSGMLTIFDRHLFYLWRFCYENLRVAGQIESEDVDDIRFIFELAESFKK